MVENYKLFNLPQSCEVKNTIFKKLFYENADLSVPDKTLFTDAINKITWLYCLKPETINIQPYKDDKREYDEIEFIEVVLVEEKRTNRMAEIIMRTIPYPMVLIFRLDNKLKLYVAHQRNSLNDSSKNTIEELISTEWVDNDNSLFEKLDIQKMRFSNYYVLYCDIVDTISIYKATALIPSDLDITGEEAKKLLERVADINIQIASVRASLKKETQFNRKMELNIKLKTLEKVKVNLING